MVENRMYPDGMDPRYIRIPVDQITKDFGASVPVGHWKHKSEFPSECRTFAVKFKKLDSRATSPTRNHLTDAGMDLYALEDVVVPSILKMFWKYARSVIWDVHTSAMEYFNMSGKKNKFSDEIEGDNIAATKVKTGIALEIPNGMYGKIFDRSSMASKLILSLGGVIDSGYRGDVTVCLTNLTFKDYQVKAGDKVAQIVFHKYEALQPVEVEELEEAERGEKGFGSSGA